MKVLGITMALLGCLACGGYGQLTGSPAPADNIVNANFAVVADTNVPADVANQFTLGGAPASTAGGSQPSPMMQLVSPGGTTSFDDLVNQIFGSSQPAAPPPPATNAVVPATTTASPFPVNNMLGAGAGMGNDLLGGLPIADFANMLTGGNTLTGGNPPPTVATPSPPPGGSMFPDGMPPPPPGAVASPPAGNIFPAGNTSPTANTAPAGSNTMFPNIGGGLTPTGTPPVIDNALSGGPTMPNNPSSGGGIPPSPPGTVNGQIVGTGIGSSNTGMGNLLNPFGQGGGPNTGLPTLPATGGLPGLPSLPKPPQRRRPAMSPMMTMMLMSSMSGGEMGGGEGMDMMFPLMIMMNQQRQQQQQRQAPPPVNRFRNLGGYVAPSRTPNSVAQQGNTIFGSPTGSSLPMATNQLPSTGGFGTLPATSGAGAGAGAMGGLDLSSFLGGAAGAGSTGGQPPATGGIDFNSLLNSVMGPPPAGGAMATSGGSAGTAANAFSGFPTMG